MSLKIAVLAGGLSTEREVSLRSGKACFEAIERLGYKAELIDIQGFSEIELLTEYKPDLAFLVTHGDFGEDGRLQGMLDWLSVPFTGSSAAASSLCMDKYLAKMVFKKEGLPTSECELNYEGAQLEVLKEKLHSERLFIKTRRGGSSIGAKELKTQADLDEKQTELEEWLIEPLVVGREITLGFIKMKGEWKELPILELKAKNEFYDYEAKYTEGMTQFILPAPMSEERREQLVSFAKRALNCCGADGYGRVDMILNEDHVHILEINTLPGMTNTSDLPAMAKAEGMSFDELVDTMIKEAL